MSAVDTMSDEQHDAVQGALMAFIQSFEQGDTEAMQRAFADGATSFPRTLADFAGTAHQFRRVDGIDPEMLAAVKRAREYGTEPPYLSIEPMDLDVRVSGDMAVATFHLLTEGELGRRTFVMMRQGDDWKILHVHASNVAYAASAGDAIQT